MKQTCDLCGQKIPELAGYHTPDGNYCPTCIDKFPFCTGCESPVMSDDKTLTMVVARQYPKETRFWCRDCIREKTKTCERCGTIYGNPNANGKTLTDADGKEIYVCTSCLDALDCCEHCGVQLTLANLAHVDDDGNSYCYNCFHAMFHCQRCDGLSNIDTITWDTNVVTVGRGTDLARTLWCHDCIKYRTKTCVKCGVRYGSPDFTGRETTNTTGEVVFICNKCIERRER